MSRIWPLDVASDLVPAMQNPGEGAASQKLLGQQAGLRASAREGCHGLKFRHLTLNICCLCALALYRKTRPWFWMIQMDL